jgi:MYXO-CTERM domain-containing protein
MRFRLALIAGLALGLPGAALAQVPTITVESGAGRDQHIIVNSEECADAADTEGFLVTIDFGVGVPAAGTTYSIKLGRTCESSDTDCLILEENVDLTADLIDHPVSFTASEAVDAVANADPVGCDNADEELKLFVEVRDAADEELATGESGAKETIFIDTIAPEPALGLKGTGGENVIHAEWDTNPANAGGGAVLNPQEAAFKLECRLAGVGDFEPCGNAVTAGLFESDIEEFDGQPLVIDTEYEFRVITTDTAGNQSAPSAAATATPINVLDFGENYEGGETWGFCDVGAAGPRNLWVPLLALALILALRRRNEEAR